MFKSYSWVYLGGNMIRRQTLRAKLIRLLMIVILLYLSSSIYKNVTVFSKKFYLMGQGGQNMKVLERWHTMVNDEIYRDVFSETELIKSSERIFKEIAGTRSFVESCQKTHEKNL